MSVVGKPLAAHGSLTITIDGATAQLAMDAGSCEAGDVLVQQMENIPRR